MSKSPQISDYTGYDYKTDYWVKADRQYENLREAQVVETLIDAHCQHRDTIADIGGGFGRLSPVYLPRFKRRLLVDFSVSMLGDAKSRFSDEIDTIQANFYKLPLKTNSLDACMTVRTLHHVESPTPFFKELARILKPGGTLIIEMPNQQHILQIVRFLLRRDSRNPFKEPRIKRGHLFYNYPYSAIHQQLEAAGLLPITALNTSFFRIGWLKKIVPATWLCAADALVGKWLKFKWLSPSIFIVCTRQK